MTRMQKETNLVQILSILAVRTIATFGVVYALQCGQHYRNAADHCRQDVIEHYLAERSTKAYTSDVLLEDE